MIDTATRYLFDEQTFEKYCVVPDADSFDDLEHYTDWCRAQKRLGIFTIGGGVPRNWAQQVGPYVDLMAKRIGEVARDILTRLLNRVEQLNSPSCVIGSLYFFRRKRSLSRTSRSRGYT